MKPAASTNNTLAQENRKYIWYFVGAAVLSEGLTQGVRLAEGIGMEFDLYNSLIGLSMIFIPMVTVNTIYAFKQLFLHRCKTDGQRLALKSTGMYIGVAVATIIFEFVYLAFGFVDDDYIALGSVELSASTSEVISNLFMATFIGIPIFLREQVKAKAAKDLALKGEQIEKIKRLNTQSQLEALQAKVNPHFLYNALNSIASLIHENPYQAEDMVLSLSELFRYSLNQTEGQLSTIDKEVEMVETYMSIELVRFQDQLTFSVEVEEGLGATRIPRFLLQPLVENAIKHGTSKVKKGEIAIRISRQDDNIAFTVQDNGPAFPDSFSFGYGVKSVTNQLELLYPDNHDFQMINEPHKQVNIVIPKTPTNA